MGLLDTDLAAVNSKKPRNSSKMMPAEPLNYRGILDAATNLPVVGDALSGAMAVYDYAKGDKASAAMNALGVLPFVSGTFIGKGAKTWDAVKAAEAEKRLAAGDDVRKVWKETGTFKGPDGHLRQEIDDSKAFYRGSKAAGSSYAEDVMLHPELYDNYSSLGKNRVIESQSPGGSYDETLGRITVGPTDANSTMLHELQHAIQQREGWARGGSTEQFKSDNDTLQSYYDALTRSQYGFMDAKSAGGIHPETGLSAKTYAENMNALSAKIDGLKKSGAGIDPNDGYRRLAGEAEARATQARMNMNMEQRLNTYPLDSYDVPIDSLIIRGGLLK